MCVCVCIYLNTHTYDIRFVLWCFVDIESRYWN